MLGDSRNTAPSPVLVAGGAGFIGSNLCLRLIKQDPGMRVVALDNLHRGGSELNVPRLLAAGVEFVHGDVRNFEDLLQIGEIELIVDAAAECSVPAGVSGDSGYVVRSNLIGALNCLELSKLRGAGFVLLSTSRVYPHERIRQFEFERKGLRLELVDPQEKRGVTAAGISERFPLDGPRTLYGATKLSAEMLAVEYHAMYGVPIVINRCGVVAGPWQMARSDQGVVGLWAAHHVFGKPLSYIGFDGFQVRDVLHVEDLVSLLLLQMRNLDALVGGTFNVGGGKETSFSLRELTEICRNVTGVSLDVGVVPDRRPGDVPWYIGDSSKVRAATGWAPSKSVREVVVDTCEWIADHREELEPVFFHPRSRTNVVDVS